MTNSVYGCVCVCVGVGVGVCVCVCVCVFLDNEYEAEEVPIAWAAPESQLKREYSRKSEVYSASQTVHEILAHGIFPYQELGRMPLDKKCRQV